MPDYVITSQNVFTGEYDCDEARPLAVAVQDGRIVAVAPREDARALAQGARVEEWGDAFMCPGFHDAHQHVFHAALFPSALATEYVGTSEADCVAHLQKWAASRPDDGSWLVSHGWREALWDPPVVPTRASLDAAFPNRPVAMYSGDAHTLWTNTAGLHALGITDHTEPPAGGSFDRDEHGQLTGVIREAAGMVYVARVLSSFTTSQLCDIYRSYFARLNAMGITSVCDMALSLLPGADGINPQVYEALEAEGSLTVRAHLFPCLSDDQSNLEELQARYMGSRLRAPGFKQFFDGVSSQHTAWCTEPYENARFPGDVGRPTVEPERMRKLVLSAAERGHAVRIHTIGDAAVHEAISIFEEAHRRYGAPTQGRNTLEHIEDIQPADIARLRAAHVVASVQPPHVTIDLAQPARDLGEWRARRMWPFDKMLAAGVPLALGTDAPVVPPTSMDVLYTAVTRRTPQGHEPQGGWYPEHRLTRAQALRAYSLGGAIAVGRERELGTLTPGKLADICVWNTNLLTCADSEIQHAVCQVTLWGQAPCDNLSHGACPQSVT
ncbi:MAG: amidohydrolase [Atopobiaceae bacterium]|nr:amidohydrolase [Atopobiaceae bacterium]